jgi:hypothetical protein
MSLASPMEQWDAVAQFGFVLSLLALGAFVWFVIGSVRASRKITKLSGKPKCRRCGYSLIGNTSGTCPECGTPVG